MFVTRLSQFQELNESAMQTGFQSHDRIACGSRLPFADCRLCRREKESPRNKTSKITCAPSEDQALRL